ncbi:hypothetical protein [Streptomyces sp. NWU339]|uniref:hypothetical protein n=1 Tax=Streptomyces sp. NWU339 TaxID=2185284 RepID=UPI0011B7CE0D|nr:hypothetical protein [Streptomyces sp. NWU339]
MAEPKGKGKTPAPRKRATKASAAFGRLNQLSASGALSKINNEGPQPAAASTALNSDGAPKADETPAAGITAEAAPASTPTVTVEPAVPPAPQRTEKPAAAAESLAQPAASRVSSVSTVPDASAPSSNVGHNDTSVDPESPAEAVPIPSQERDHVVQRAGAPTMGTTPELPNTLIRGLSDPAPGISAPTGEVAVRRTAGPAFPASSGYAESKMLDALPPQLEQKVQGLPVAYYELAKSYRLAQATRTGKKNAKRNIRLHDEVATAVNRQMVSDKRMLGLRALKPSHYVDAAITLVREVPVADLIKAADDFRDQHLGEEGGSASANHYSISTKNDEWLDDMMDELLLANTTGLHGHMINVIVQSLLAQLQAEAPA